MFGKHTAFIVPSYAATFIVIVLLIIWIVMVYRSRQREIADLESRGIRRANTTKSSSGKTGTEK